tara:strand:+ start:225 stop:407 length:183 start_codon:yes stop_codon:yes gene_type:complete
MGELFLFGAGIVTGIILVRVYEGFFVKKEFKVIKGKTITMPGSGTVDDSKEKDILEDKPL